MIFRLCLIRSSQDNTANTSSGGTRQAPLEKPALASPRVVREAGIKQVGSVADLEPSPFSHSQSP
jgi:hypothetical protein